MARTVSVAQARANLADLLGSVHYTEEPVIVERKGKPFVVVISAAQYERFRQEQERAWAVVDQIRERNAGEGPEQVEADVAAEAAAVRAQARGGRG